MIEAAREHGKTELLVKTDILYEIGDDPNVRVLIISDIHEKSQERTRLLRLHMERNEEYRRRFPHVEIVEKDGDHSFTVARDRLLKEPTVTSTYAGGPISGGRYDLIRCDDLVNLIRNSKTAQARKYLKEWFYRDVVNSLARGGRLTMLGTPQHFEDLHAVVENDRRFMVAKYPGVDEEETGYGTLGYRGKNEARGVSPGSPDADCLWPGMHDRRTHEEKKEGDFETYLSQQQLQNVPPGSLVYRRPLVEAALQRGKVVRPDKDANQILALDPGYSKRASLLAIQERVGDRVEMWGEYSFTQIDDDGIAEVVVQHCKDWGVATIYMDAEDPKLAAAIGRELENAGLDVEIVRVPFGKYKQLAIGATRWLLNGTRLAWRGETTTVYRPGRVAVKNSKFREEVLDYALDPNNKDQPVKENDHGPDAWASYAYRWIEPWLEATEARDREEEPVDRALRRD